MKLASIMASALIELRIAVLSSGIFLIKDLISSGRIFFELNLLMSIFLIASKVGL